MSDPNQDIVHRLLHWAYTICTFNKAQVARDAAAEIRHLRDETVRLAVLRGLIEADLDEARVKVAAIEAMGYEWRWTRSIDENGEQVGAWVMRHDAAEAMSFVSVTDTASLNLTMGNLCQMVRERDSRSEERVD